MESDNSNDRRRGNGMFWVWVMGSLLLRLILVYSPLSSSLSLRPEVSTPLTSLRRLAEGYWLKQSSMSPYAGSMYHGSPLLLTVLGPLSLMRIEGHLKAVLSSFPYIIADLASAILIRRSGQCLHVSYGLNLQALGMKVNPKRTEDIAALAYLWNPFTIVSCVGLSLSPIENFFVILALYGGCTRIVPLAAFGWVIATHLSLYPLILLIPVILLLGYGPDCPPQKLKLGSSCEPNDKTIQSRQQSPFEWSAVIHFTFWAIFWSGCVVSLCQLCVSEYSNLWEVLRRTYGFVLSVEDLSPNVGVLWYFFAEVFDFFRTFFQIVFHVNILFLILPLAIRLHHRPYFLAFVYTAITSMLKSYPSMGDSALCLGLLGLFLHQLADMRFTFFLCCGYVGVSLLSPVMHNLWIWRGTGNANFYFATAIGYACLQIVLIVESVSAMLNHDRKLRRLMNAREQS